MPPSPARRLPATAGCSWRAAAAIVQLEGRDRPRNVVARFPSLEAAVACYHSPEYQAALAHAKGAADRELMVLEEA